MLRFSLRTLLLIVTLLSILLTVVNLFPHYPLLILAVLATAPMFYLAATVLGAIYLQDDYRAFCLGAAIAYACPCVVFWLVLIYRLVDLRSGGWTAFQINQYLLNGSLGLSNDAFAFLGMLIITCTSSIIFGGYVGIAIRHLGIEQAKRKADRERGNQATSDSSTIRAD